MGCFIVGCIVADVPKYIFVLLMSCIFLHSVYHPAHAFDEIFVINCILQFVCFFYFVKCLYWLMD